MTSFALYLVFLVIGIVIGRLVFPKTSKKEEESRNKQFNKLVYQHISKENPPLYHTLSDWEIVPQTGSRLHFWFYIEPDYKKSIM